MIYFLREYFRLSESFNSNISHPFLQQNNLCDFTTHKQKFKRWFCTQNLILNIHFKDHLKQIGVKSISFILGYHNLQCWNCHRVPSLHNYSSVHQSTNHVLFNTNNSTPLLTKFNNSCVRCLSCRQVFN